jgi:hypothetical protein
MGKGGMPQPKENYCNHIPHLSSNEGKSSQEGLLELILDFDFFFGCDQKHFIFAALCAADTKKFRN